MGVPLVGGRVSLRHVREDDLATIAPWYGEAASAANEDRSIEELRTSTLLAITNPEDDAPIGLLEYRAEEGRLTIAFIALAKAYRGWGYGSEAVRLVEEWALRERLAEGFRADVDVRNGLGLYFWLRLGYRPLAAEEGRAVLAMVREAGQLRD